MGIKARNGGLWPLMPQGSFREKELETAAFAMPEGQVSDAMETPTGYYIVKVHKVQAGRIVTFEQAQEQIDQTLRQEQFRKLADDYFNLLTEGATVIQPGKLIDLAVDRAVEQYYKNR